MEKLVSVIVPVYNVEEYLEKCVDSIVNQTYRNLEIILIDDGSTDSSGSICDRLAAEDRRIRVIHKKNGGLSDARNAGLDVAKGDYICFVDSDDHVAPDYIQYFFDLIHKGTDVGIAVCSMQRSSGIIIKTVDEEVVCNTTDAFNKMFYYQRQYGIYMWNKMFEARLFQNVRFPLHAYYEDSAVIHLLVGQVGQVSFGPERKYYYNDLRPGSTINVYSYKNFSDKMRFLREMEVYISQNFPGALRGYRKFAAYSYLSMIEKLCDRYKDEPNYREELKTYRGELKRVLGKVLMDERVAANRKQAMLFSMSMPAPVIYTRRKLKGMN